MSRKVREEEVLFTEDVAQRYIDNYVYEFQRDLVQKHVEELSTLMQDGLFNSSITRVCLGYIKGTTAYKILDANHTLHGIVLSGCPQKLLVEYHVCDDAADMKRLYLAHNPKEKNFKDNIKASGIAPELGISVQEAKEYASALKYIALGSYTLNLGPRVGMHIESTTQNMRSWNKEYNKFKNIVLSPTAPIYNTQAYDNIKVHMLRSTTLALALITLRYAEKEAVKLWTAVRLNDGLAAGSPERYLFDFLDISTHSYGASQVKEKHLTPQQLFKHLIEIWNAYFDGTPVPDITIRKTKLKNKKTDTIVKELPVSGTPFSTKIRVPSRGEKKRKTVVKNVTQSKLDKMKTTIKKKYPGLLEKLGKKSDLQLTREYPLSKGSIWNYRVSFGIPAYEQEDGKCKAA